MKQSLAPVFLDRGLIDLLHNEGLRAHGGAPGVRDNNAVESAIGRALHVSSYLVGCDVFDIAATYAHGIAEAQGYADGNKRTGVAAALIFLEVNGVKTQGVSDDELFSLMIGAAKRKVSRDDIAQTLRERLS